MPQNQIFTYSNFRKSATLLYLHPHKRVFKLNSPVFPNIESRASYKHAKGVRVLLSLGLKRVGAPFSHPTCRTRGAKKDDGMLPPSFRHNILLQHSQFLPYALTTNLFYSTLLRPYANKPTSPWRIFDIIVSTDIYKFFHLAKFYIIHIYIKLIYTLRRVHVHCSFVLHESP